MSPARPREFAAMRLVPALSALLLLPTLGHGQITGPADLDVKLGSKNNVLVVRVAADNAEYEVLDDIEVIREPARVGELRLRVLAYTAGHGTIIVFGVKDGKALPLYKCRVVVAGPAPPTPVPPNPPPPPPDPPPVPPAPADPLADDLRAAARKDGYSKLPQLAEAYRAAADAAGKSQTYGELETAFSKAIPKIGSEAPSVLAVTRREVRGLDSVIPPSTPGELLTAGQRASAKALFTKIADALDRASRQ